MLEPPKNIEPGQSLAGGIYSKIREILMYLERSRLIPGSGIRLMETPCGITVSAEADRRAASGIRRKEIGFPEYTGPWSLYYVGGDWINIRPGLLWTPDGAKFGQQRYFAKPAVSSFIILSNAADSGILTMADDGTLETFTRENPHYWDNHAILGRYDAQEDSVTQYHFSPIVFFIETEDFIITP